MLKLSQIPDAALALATANGHPVTLSGSCRQFITTADGYEGALYYDLIGNREFNDSLTAQNRVALDVATGGVIRGNRHTGRHVRRSRILRRMLLRKFGFDSDGK